MEREEFFGKMSLYVSTEDPDAKPRTLFGGRRRPRLPKASKP